jgi:hypothetical protein
MNMKAGRIGMEFPELRKMSPVPDSSREQARKSPAAPGKWRRNSGDFSSGLAIRLFIVWSWCTSGARVLPR